MLAGYSIVIRLRSVQIVLPKQPAEKLLAKTLAIIHMSAGSNMKKGIAPGNLVGVAFSITRQAERGIFEWPTDSRLK
jgi:hypothetical protein